MTPTPLSVQHQTGNNLTVAESSALLYPSAEHTLRKYGLIGLNNKVFSMGNYDSYICVYVYMYTYACEHIYVYVCA